MLDQRDSSEEQTSATMKTEGSHDFRRAPETWGLRVRPPSDRPAAADLSAIAMFTISTIGCRSLVAVAISNTPALAQCC